MSTLYTEETVWPFVPYEVTGGTAIALAGQDFAIIAADKRLGINNTLHSRHENKLFHLSANAVLASTNSLCDSLALVGKLREKAQDYKYTHHKEINVESLAQLLSNLMYNQRFFPYNVSNLLAGVNKSGKGAVYSFDALGHLLQHHVIAVGTAGHLISPVLDSLAEPFVVRAADRFTLNLNISVKMAQDIALLAFKAATARDIYTGDCVSIKIITANNIKCYEVPSSKI